MSNYKRLLGLLPLMFVFSLAALHVVAQPDDETPNMPIEVITGIAHTCGIRLNGTLQCWGANQYGQSSPPVDLGTVKAVSVGMIHTCAIKSDDTLSCWGGNDLEQITLPAGLGTVKAVSTKYYHTCAIKSDDTLVCWGRNNYGQTTLPADLGKVKAVSVGNIHTCAIKSDGTLICWGDNEEEKITLPAGVGMLKAISVGSYHTCAIKSDDTLICWGRRQEGQITLPIGLGTVKAVTTGDYHTCAIKSDDTLICWGTQNYWQTKLPPGLGTVKAVSAGGDYTCVIKSDDTLTCWGDNYSGQLNLPQPLISLNSPSLTMIEGSSLTVKVSASQYGWDNIIVSFTYTGTATRKSDYEASSAVLITTSDNVADLVINSVADAQSEVDETIILNIYFVTGGVESGMQQMTLLIQDNEGVNSTHTATLEAPITTPTSTVEGAITPNPATPTAILETPQSNLLINNSFENGLTPWMVKTGVGDKVKCNKDGKPPVARTGTCAFQFKGGAGERSKLEQSIALASQAWAAGDTLNLSAFVKATNSAVNGKIKVRVKYTDGTATGKIEANIVPNSDYTDLTGNYMLLSGNVSKVKLSIQNRSLAGKIFVDDVALLYTSGNGAMLLALP